LLSFLLTVLVLPSDKSAKWEWNRIDWGGILFFTTGIVFTILFLLSIENHIKWWALGAAAVSFGLLYRIEKSRKEPLINLEMLKKNKNIGFIYLQFICINLIFYSIFFGIPTFLQQARHYNEQETGLIMLTLAGFGVFIAPIAGQWIDRSGSKPALLAGAITVMTGTVLLLTISAHSPLWWLLIVLSVLGVSNGFNNIAMQTALYAFVTPKETGSASGLFMTSRYLGTILSSSLLGLMFSQQINDVHLHAVAWVLIVFSLLVLSLTLRLPSRSKEGAAN
jgi:predicted MFS family arabinose efflux permease